MVRLELALVLTYEVTGPEGADFIFNIHAARTTHQYVRHESLKISQPIVPDITTDPATGARTTRLRAQEGPLCVLYEAVLDLHHHRADPATLQEVPIGQLPQDVLPYLYPSRYCQSDRLLSLAFREFGHLPTGYSRVMAIQRWVQERVRFESNTSDATTSAVDTLVQGAGVCRDFAHLMVALCRASNIPARLATGTDYGADPALGPPDLHAYVEVFLSDRWYIFDPSGTSIPMGFMRFGVGRDAADVAFATIFGPVKANAPVVELRALAGPGLSLPEHVEDALSTCAAPRLGASPESLVMGSGLDMLDSEPMPLMVVEPTSSFVPRALC